MKSSIHAASVSERHLPSLKIEEVIVKHTANEREKKISINITFQKNKEKVMYSVEDYNGLYIMNTPNFQQAIIRYNAIKLPVPIIIEVPMEPKAYPSCE